MENTDSYHFLRNFFNNYTILSPIIRQGEFRFSGGGLKNISEVVRVMILDLTLVEFHRTEITQPTKFVACNHLNVLPDGLASTNPIFGKRSDN